MARGRLRRPGRGRHRSGRGGPADRRLRRTHVPGDLRRQLFAQGVPEVSRVVRAVFVGLVRRGPRRLSSWRSSSRSPSSRSIVRNVNRLTRAATAIAGGNFSVRVNSKSRDQIGELARSFDGMAASIQWLLNETARKEKLEAELAVARAIQESFLPESGGPWKGFEATAHFEPVGGSGRRLLRHPADARRTDGRDDRRRLRARPSDRPRRGRRARVACDVRRARRSGRRGVRPARQPHDPVARLGASPLHDPLVLRLRRAAAHRDADERRASGPLSHLVGTRGTARTSRAADRAASGEARVLRFEGVRVRCRRSGRLLHGRRRGGRRRPR